MIRRSGLIVAALGALLFAGTASAQMAKPQVTEPLTAERVPAAPYDEAADAHAEVALAIARAAATHKYVLLDFGGNWCPDCRVTAGILGLGSVKPWIDKTFVPVFVDVGRYKKNMDIAQHYNVDIKAVPTLIILDPQGRMVNAGNPSALQDARSMTPQAVVDTIYGWIQKPA